jgi:hypothetical protein
MPDDFDYPLREQAGTFADRVASLLEGTVADSAPITVTRAGNRLAVASSDGNNRSQPITLTCRGTPVVDLWLRYLCSWDSYGSYLAVDKSSIRLCVHRVREPLIRFEYERQRRDGLAAHIQVHAENSDLGWLSAKTDRPRNPLLPSIHLPVGGRRFRTPLEDIVEMAIRDLGVDCTEQWKDALRLHRDEWLGTQTQAVVRDRAVLVANALRELGWTVTAPAAQA